MHRSVRKLQLKLLNKRLFAARGSPHAASPWRPPCRLVSCRFCLPPSLPTPQSSFASERVLRQYLYFCTSKASKLSTLAPQVIEEPLWRVSVFVLLY